MVTLKLHDTRKYFYPSDSELFRKPKNKIIKKKIKEAMYSEMVVWWTG